MPQTKAIILNTSYKLFLAQNYTIGVASQNLRGSRVRCRSASQLMIWRTGLGMTQAEFARRAFGVSQATYAVWETCMDEERLRLRLRCSPESRKPGAESVRPYYYERLARMLQEQTGDVLSFQTQDVAQQLGIYHKTDFDIDEEHPGEADKEYEENTSMDRSYIPKLHEQTDFVIIHPNGLNFVAHGNLRTAEMVHSMGKIQFLGDLPEGSAAFLTVVSDDRFDGDGPYCLKKGTLIVVDRSDKTLRDGAIFLCKYGKDIELGIAVQEGKKWYAVSPHWNQRRYPPRRLGIKADVLGRVRTLAEILAGKLDEGTDRKGRGA